MYYKCGISTWGESFYKSRVTIQNYEIMEGILILTSKDISQLERE